MKRYILPILLSLLLFCSCGKKVILDQDRTFANATWMRFEPESFQVDAPNTEDCYNIYFTAHIDTALFHEKGLPLILEMVGPDGEKRSLFPSVVLRNHEGTWMGEIDNQGILTVSQMVRQFYFFNSKGTHTINLSQRTSKYQIEGIRDINLRVEKVKIELPE